MNLTFSILFVTILISFVITNVFWRDGFFIDSLTGYEWITFDIAFE